ncbi:hypothetical protein [Sinorhizobium meliloti]|uniref:hypothetical protein n=1 Tax=Rhizobium meliloti TaxID=382 RepID=UPI0012BBEBD5|nr:hypothetical protein [Sinorhizobium meliloti]UFX12256.1 hypothetical protein SmelRRI128_25985 [Sinorhizobium meliloti]
MIEMNSFLLLASSFFSSAFIKLLRGASVVVAGLCVVWLVLFALHVAIPSNVIAAVHPNAAMLKDLFFEDADRALGRGINQPDSPGVDGDFLRTTAGSWDKQCLRQGKIEPRRARLGEQTFHLTKEIYYRLNSYKKELEDLRQNSVIFASVLIMLGMATTIVSALNSSEFGSGTSRSASTIKVTAIVLPALGTAITAYAALYAPSDQAARKAQLVSNLTGIGSDISVVLTQATCPIPDADIASLERQLANWRRRLNDTVAGAETSEFFTKGLEGAPKEPEAERQPPNPAKE